MSILVADDYAPARFLRSRILADAGFAVMEADSAAATLKAVLHEGIPPELVLLDVGLPDGNGFEICERIKAANPTLPVVLISAIYCTAHARRDGYSAGADAYLVDPTAPARLIDTVRQLTGGGRLSNISCGIVRTTASGDILWVNDTAARLLNLSERAAPGRNLLIFFNSQRTRLLHEMSRAVSGHVCELDAQLRPRERRPYPVRIDLSMVPDVQSLELEWVIEQM